MISSVQRVVEEAAIAEPGQPSRLPISSALLRLERSRTIWSRDCSSFSDQHVHFVLHGAIVADQGEHDLVDRLVRAAPRELAVGAGQATC